ncbi:MAG: zinc-binding dehydrogenase [Clostridiales bacterium]|nr:zinc-binding dehydrogenase [Clostridiales bacterium]
MRKLIAVAAGKLEVQDVAMPVPEGDQVLIRIRASGICHSDLHIAEGDWQHTMGLTYPADIGHEGIGVVEELGPDAGKLVKKGDRVIFGLGGAGGADWCGACEYCFAGKTMHCNHSVQLMGTYADYIAVKEKALVILPDEIKDTDAPLACAGLTSYSAIKKIFKFGVSAGQKVAIIGAGGGVGHFAVQFAKVFGYKVIGVDIGAEKMEFLKSIGADYAVDVAEADKVIGELGGVHAAIVFSPYTDSFELALRIARKGGVIVGVSLPAETERPIPIYEFMMVFKDLTYMASLVGNVEEMRELIAIAAEGKVKTEVSRIVGLGEVGEVFADMKAGKIKGRVVIDLVNK